MSNLPLKGKLLPMTEEMLALYHTEYYFGQPTYISLTTRGCPFMCAYCFNSQLVAAYKSRKIRYRDLHKVIHEEIKPAGGPAASTPPRYRSLQPRWSGSNFSLCVSSHPWAST